MDGSPQKRGIDEVDSEDGDEEGDANEDNPKGKKRKIDLGQVATDFLKTSVSDLEKAEATFAAKLEMANEALTEYDK